MDDGEKVVGCPNCGFQLTPSNMSKARRLPIDWQPSEKMLAHAKAIRPDVDPKREAILFRNYWTSKGGKDAAKLNWEATFENWILNAKPTPVVERRTTPSPAVVEPGRKRLDPEQRAANRVRLAEMLAGLGK